MHSKTASMVIILGVGVEPGALQASQGQLLTSSLDPGHQLLGTIYPATGFIFLQGKGLSQLL